jgi:hypothetical protein
MACDWLIGVEEKGHVQLYAVCGTCRARWPVGDGKQAREVLDWHAPAGQCVTGLFDRVGAA